MRCFYLFVYITVCKTFCWSFETGKSYKKYYSTDNLIDPNDWSNDVYYRAKERFKDSPYANEFLHIEHNYCKVKTGVEKTVAEYGTVRRFVNLLLKRAHFQDSEGNAVPLGSISSSENSKLVMSFAVSASPKELKILQEFGQKKSSSYIRQIDEVLTNMLSASAPESLKKCSSKSWAENIGIMWNSIWERVDFMVLLYIMTVLYVIWSAKVTLARGGSWKSILLCFLLPSIVWEFSRLLEEETIKQYSDRLRLGNIPDNCYGVDNRSWWEKIFEPSSEVKCYEYHLQRMGNPVLKVSIFKVVLSQLQLVLNVIVTFIKELTAANKDDWFFTSIIMRTVIWMCITFAFIAIVMMYVLPNHPVVSRISRTMVSGSRVEPIRETGEEMIKPPPRRRNRNSKKRSSDEIDGRLPKSIIYNITGHNVSLVTGSGTDGKDSSVQHERAESSVPGMETAGAISYQPATLPHSEGETTREGKAPLHMEEGSKTETEEESESDVSAVESEKDDEAGNV